MIVAIDATPLTISSGGIRRYTAELTRALALEFPQDTFHLISDQRYEYSSAPNINVHLPDAAWLSSKWWSIGVQRKMASIGCDVFHGTDFAVPYLPLRPSVMTLHDLSPWKEAGWHYGADRVRHRCPLLARLGIATMIVTPTEAVRRETIARFQVSPSRVAAVHHAASMAPAARSPVRPYFLFVGTLEPRKNIPALLEAWRSVRLDCNIDLMLVGRLREDGPRIQPQPGLLLAGEIEDEALPALYSGSIATIYPSLYEGFGLPLLEAMQCGAAVIASNDPALREVSNGAALHVENYDLADAMRKLAFNVEERKRRQELSLQRANDFSWARTARQTRDVYVEAIRRFHA